MDLNRTTTLKIIRYGTMSIVALIIILYALSRSLNYIHGPQIEIFQPINGSAIASTTTTIIGRALRINSLSLNGETVFIDESGNFQDTIIIFPGINNIDLTAQDQFGRSVTNQLEVIGTVQQDK